MMRFIKQNLTEIDGVAIWPLISLSIFFLFFVGLGIHVWRMRKTHVDDMSNMPLTDDEDGPIQPRSRQKDRGKALKAVAMFFFAVGLTGLAPLQAVAQEAEAEVMVPGTHYGMSDDYWLMLLLGGAVLWTAMILATLGIFRNLAEHRARKSAPLRLHGLGVLVAVYILSDSTFWGLIVANLFLMGYLVLILRIVGLLAQDLRPKRERKAKEATAEAKDSAPRWLERVWQVLNGHKSLAQEEDLMLNHAYDGIKELDNRLPPWWLYGFYVSIFFGVLYLFNFHIFGYQPLSAEAYEVSMIEAEAEVNAYLASMALNVDEHSVEYVLEDGRLNNGRTIFTKNCVACHAADGGGGVGPNLVDNYWLHGGSIADVFKSIKYGIPAKGMRSWKSDLTPTEIQNVSTFILSIQGTTPMQPKDPQGNEEAPAVPQNEARPEDGETTTPNADEALSADNTTAAL